jgi:hypothetical protein
MNFEWDPRGSPERLVVILMCLVCAIALYVLSAQRGVRVVSHRACLRGYPEIGVLGLSTGASTWLLKDM